MSLLHDCPLMLVIDLVAVIDTLDVNGPESYHSESIRVHMNLRLLHLYLAWYVIEECVSGSWST
mgnify:CR=1 FL=1